MRAEREDGEKLNLEKRGKTGYNKAIIWWQGRYAPAARTLERIEGNDYGPHHHRLGVR